MRDEDLPSRENYQVLTEAMALRAKARANSKPSTSRPVAVLEEVANTSADSSNTSGYLGNTVNVLMPSPQIDDEAGDDSFVSTPLKIPHIRWPCLLQQAGSSVPLRTKALIDNGSFLVLIREDFVKQLRYVPLRLPEPITVSDYGVKSETSLIYYVDIQPSSICESWCSAPVHAVVSPNLCAPLVLGLPFLNVNKLVIDHETFCVLDKVNNVNVCGLNTSQKNGLSNKQAHRLQQATNNSRRKLRLERKQVLTARKKL